MARKRIVPKGIKTASGEIVAESYCTKCMNTKRADEFYQALDIYTHKNGLSHMCKSCEISIYDDVFGKSLGEMDSLEKYCRIVSIPFDSDISNKISELHRRQEEEEKRKKHPVSLYNQYIKSKFLERDRSGEFYSLDLTYSQEVTKRHRIEINEDELEMDDFWESPYPSLHLLYLNERRDEFKEAFGLESPSEIYLLKQLCKKMLLIKKEEEEQTPDLKVIASLEGESQKIMKTLGVSPEQIKINNSGNSKKAFGTWTRDIERFAPAEWLEHEGKELYYDVDNIELYHDNFFTRPLKNLISGISNFRIRKDDGSEEDWAV